MPYSLALGLWVGIVSQFIPTVGTYIAMVLPVLVAFKESPSTALYVLVFLVLYQQFENYILGPRVTKHSMDVHPALAIGTVFAGGLLLGGVGAILALPATAVIQALISGYTTEREIIDAPLVEEPERTSRLAALPQAVTPQARRRASGLSGGGAQIGGIEVEHLDRVGPHDALELVGRDLLADLGDDLGGVGPGRVLVRVVGLEHE